MATQASMQITLYDPETNEVVKRYSRLFIPTGIFTEVVRLMKSVDLEHPDTLDEDAIETMFALVVEIFGEQFSIDDVRRGTDLLEVVALLTNIMARVNAVMPASGPNPTLPGKTRPRHR